MVRAIIVETAKLWTWWLQLDTPTGCDVLVRATGSYGNEAACRAAVRRASRAVEVDPLAVLSVQTTDGSWHLGFHDVDGHQVATSAGSFSTARASRADIGRLLQAFAVHSVVVAPLARRRNPSPRPAGLRQRVGQPATKE